MMPALDREPPDRREAAKAARLKASAGIREELLATFAAYYAYYAKSFTPAELNEIVAFYGGPIGRKLSQMEQNKPAEVSDAIRTQMMKLMVLFGTPQDGAR
ncbi:DUF2059 domain-containing protein [Xanthobacter sediminis]